MLQDCDLKIVAKPATAATAGSKKAYIHALYGNHFVLPLATPEFVDDSLVVYNTSESTLTAIEGKQTWQQCKLTLFVVAGHSLNALTVNMTSTVTEFGVGTLDLEKPGREVLQIPQSITLYSNNVKVKGWGISTKNANLIVSKGTVELYHSQFTGTSSILTGMGDVALSLTSPVKVGWQIRSQANEGGNATLISSSTGAIENAAYCLGSDANITSSPVTCQQVNANSTQRICKGSTTLCTADASCDSAQLPGLTLQVNQGGIYVKTASDFSKPGPVCAVPCSYSAQAQNGNCCLQRAPAFNQPSSMRFDAVGNKANPV